LSLNDCFLKSDISIAEYQVLASVGRSRAFPAISDKEMVEKIREAERKWEVQDFLLVSVAQCESGLRHYGVWGDNYRSYGIFQFWESTFYKYADEGMDWKDLDDQIDTAAKMFSLGIRSCWTCYSKLY